MFIKVIKKNRSKTENTNSIRKEKQSAPNPEKKIEQTVMQWISEFKEKKVFEFKQPNFLTNKAS